MAPKQQLVQGVNNKTVRSYFLSSQNVSLNVKKKHDARFSLHNTTGVNGSRTHWRLDPPWSPPQTTAHRLVPDDASPTPSATCRRDIVTLGVLYYDSPWMLRVHAREWATWGASVQRHYEIIVVDDGSAPQNGAARILNEPLGGTLVLPPVRILWVLPPKLPWNIGGGAIC